MSSSASPFIAKPKSVSNLYSSFDWIQICFSSPNTKILVRIIDEYEQPPSIENSPILPMS